MDDKSALRRVYRLWAQIWMWVPKLISCLGSNCISTKHGLKIGVFFLPRKEWANVKLTLRRAHRLWPRSNLRVFGIDYSSRKRNFISHDRVNCFCEFSRGLRDSFYEFARRGVGGEHTGYGPVDSYAFSKLFSYIDTNFKSRKYLRCKCVHEWIVSNFYSVQEQ